MRPLLWSFAISAHLVCAAAIVRGVSDSDTGALDARVQAFAQQLRCLVCQNETLADSQAELAVDLRREIREQMVAGRSDEEILAFFTARYGEFVRYRPPWQPSTYLLWCGPLLLLGGGLVALYRSLSNWQAMPESRPLTLKQQQRARQLLNVPRRDERV
jgi:cytochrome c-type biogenesis protein CcmH